MSVSDNVERFVDLAINDQFFRAAISSGDRQTIIDALVDNDFDLTPQEMGEAADELIANGSLAHLSKLEEILSRPPGTRGN